MNEPLGNAAILAGSAVWAIALAYFKKAGATLSGAQLNLAKNLLGLASIGALALFWEGLRPGGDPLAIAAIFFAGVVGMGAGDTFFLGAIKRLGVGRTTVLILVTPLLTLGVEVVAFGWRPPPAQIAGLVLVLAGVALAIGPGKHAALEWAGVRMVLIAAVGFAAGQLLTRWGFDRVEDGMGLVTSTFLRLLGGVLWSVLVLRLSPSGVWRRAYGPPATRAPMLKGAILGTVIGILLYQTAGKYTRATMVAALGATVPLFAIPAAWIIDRERPTWSEIAGALCGVSGVALVSLGGP